MKILMTGSEGMLGSDIIEILKKEHQVIGFDKEQLDITDRSALEAAFNMHQPELVLHLAALTDLDYCERNPVDAFKVNTEATADIAELCALHGSNMIYISTSGVFQGNRKKPYSEDDIPNPVSIYGQSKYNGEKEVRRFLDDDSWLILRAGWLFGGGNRDKKFVGKMYKLMKKLDEVKVVDDIYGSPVYTKDFGETIQFLIAKKASGLYHIVNEGIVSRYEIALEMKSIVGFDTKTQRASADEFPAVAPRPPMEGIVSHNLKERYEYRLRNWKEALGEYLKRLDK
ncbi:MAG: dTDP-4-dehydrorhamnose reductase [Candidatus Zixiibacteriota bacterium]